MPAIFIAGLLAVYSYVVGKKIPGAREPFSWPRLKRALKDGIWALLLPFIVLGGIYGGLYTPSEAGAAATVYALVVTMFVYRELSVRRLIETLTESATLMGSLILIIVLAFGLNEFLALIEIQDRLMEWITAMHLGPAGFMLLVNVILIILGALMDSISATLVFAPMLAPVAWKLYGIDPLHFGVVFVVNMEIGYLMPPVATNLFVAAAVFKKPFGLVTRAIVPTLTITCLALGVIMYVPTIAKATVNWKRGLPIYEAFPWAGRPPEPSEDVTAKKAAPSDDQAEPEAKPVHGPDLGALTAKAFKDDDDDADAGPASRPATQP